MSAYLHRLIQRFSPPGGEGGSAEAVPFVRSASPIAAHDQLGQGLEPLGRAGSFDRDDGDGHEQHGARRVASPATPERVQRKAMAAAPAMSPTPSGDASTMAPPAPGFVAPPPPPFGQPALPKPESWQARPEPTALTPQREPMDPFQTSPAPEPIEPGEPSLSPPREPMDPGELFAPVPRFFDEQVTRAEPRPTSEATRLTPQPSARPEPRVAALPPALTTRAQHERSPWAPYAPQLPTLPGLTPLEAPPLDPRPASPSSPRVETQTQALLVAPRAAAAKPFIPDPGELAPASATRTAPRVSIGRVEIEVVPAQAAAPSQATGPTRNAHGKLDIESISQIGPLARHFPNRRRLRLRYR